MIDKNSPEPLYSQLDRELRAEIASGKYKPNSAIPSETELCQIYGISRMTIRSVITQLVNEGLLHRVQGKGTFVVDRKIPATSPAYMGVREQLERLGYQTATKLLMFKQEKASAAQVKALGVPLGETLHYIVRVRSIDGLPISLHRSYIPRYLCPALTGDNLEKEQLCTILQQEFGLKTAYVSETLESTLATNQEAKALEINPGFPLLLLEDINKTANGRIFEYTKVLFRGDKFKLNFEYDLKEKR